MGNIGVYLRKNSKTKGITMGRTAKQKEDKSLTKMGEFKQIDISLLENNEGQLPDVPKNPRWIKDEEYATLKKSLLASPEFLEYKPLMVYKLTNGKYVTICGNMRLRVSNELLKGGHTEFASLPCFVLNADTPIQKIKEYAIKDNVQAGNWDWDELANGDWEVDELTDWGVDCSFLTDTEETDNLVGEENTKEGDNEVDVDTFDDKIEMKLKFTIDEHRFINDKLREYDDNNETALLKMLGYEE